MVKRIVGKQLKICLESWTQVRKGDGIKKGLSQFGGPGCQPKECGIHSCS